MKAFVLCLVVTGVLTGFLPALAAEGEPEELAPGLFVSLDTSRANRPPQEFPFFSNSIKDMLRSWWLSEGQAALQGNCGVQIIYEPGGPGFVFDPAMIVAIFSIDPKAHGGIFFSIAIHVSDRRDSFRRAAPILVDGARGALRRWVREREAELRRQKLLGEIREKLLQE